VNSAEHCSHCTEKTQDQEKKEKRDIMSSHTSPNIWLISGDVVKSPCCPKTSLCM